MEPNPQQQHPRSIVLDAKPPPLSHLHSPCSPPLSCAKSRANDEPCPQWHRRRIEVTNTTTTQIISTTFPPSSPTVRKLGIPRSVTTRERVSIQWEKKGACGGCGHRCFIRKKFKLIALTEPGKVFEGRCLNCNPFESKYECCGGHSGTLEGETTMTNGKTETSTAPTTDEEENQRERLVRRSLSSLGESTSCSQVKGPDRDAMPQDDVQDNSPADPSEKDGNPDETPVRQQWQTLKIEFSGEKKGVSPASSSARPEPTFHCAKLGHGTLFTSSLKPLLYQGYATAGVHYNHPMPLTSFFPMMRPQAIVVRSTRIGGSGKKKGRKDGAQDEEDELDVMLEDVTALEDDDSSWGREEHRKEYSNGDAGMGAAERALTEPL